MSSSEPQWVLRQETCKNWVVVSQAVVVEPGAVVLAPGVLEGVGIGRAGGLDLTERAIGVGGGDGPGAVRKSQDAPEGIREVVARPRRAPPGKELVDSGAVEIAKFSYS